MLKFAFEIQAFLRILYTEERKVVYKSAIFGHIKRKFSMLVHLDGFYNMCSGFTTNEKEIQKSKIYIFFKFGK